MGFGESEAEEEEMNIETIETRYRDISFEQARQCSTRTSEAYVNEAEARKRWEEQRRRKTLKIRVPHRDGKSPHEKCDGPWFTVVEISGKTVDGISACPHIAEIGD